MRSYLHPPFYLAKSIFAYLLGLKNNTRFYLAGKCLVENMSYRLPAKADKDWLIAFRVFKYTVISIWKKEFFYKKIGTSNVLLLAGNYEKMEFIPDYINKQELDEPIGWFVERNKLRTAQSAFDKILLSVVAVKYLFYIFPVCFFSKNRASYALIIREVVEHINLATFISKHKINKVVDFLPFEKDSNLLAVLLNSFGVEVDKMPSSGPLATHNHTIISNTLYITNQYQQEEIQHYKDTMLVKKVKKIVPEFTFSYIDNYKGKDKKPPKNTIGYYSHGAWLRKLDGHADDGLGIAKAEEVLLKELQTYLTENPEIHLTIFPHPREKNEQLMNKTAAYYKQHFNGLNYSLVTKKEKNSLLFDKVDVAVASFSTIIYERLFVGYKTLIGAYGISNFPLPNSSLSSIALRNNEKLAGKLSESMQLSENDFFEQNNLTGYRYFEYEYFKRNNS